MQCPYFLEDPNNHLLRESVGVKSSMAEEEKFMKLVMKDWLFRVRVFDLRQEETVCVIGSVQELGNWVPEKCVPLAKEGDTEIWSQVIKIPDDYVEYRYCICVILENGSHVIVRNWETHISTRSIAKHSKSPTNKDEVDIYGLNQSVEKFERGWITNETIVQIKIFKNALSLWRPRYENRPVYLKVTPINLNKHKTSYPKTLADALEESLSTDTQDAEDNSLHAYTEVAVLNSEDSRFQPQPQFGVEVNGELIIYQSSMQHMQNTAFLIDLFVYSSRCNEDQPPYHAGFTYLLPSALQGSEGKSVLALTSTKQRPLGELIIEYLQIRPIANFACNMKQSFAKHWKKTRLGLEVGHRGSGSSYKIEPRNCAEVRENTLASFKTAIDHGADYLEFDVQLSKDLVPIIYHDFHVYVAMKKRKNLDDSDLLECPLKDLTLEQLRLLKVYHLSEGKSKKERFFDEDLEEHQPFPTLEQLFDVLSPMVGFNIEIKWTMEQMDGTYELQNPMDLNMYIDIILKSVLQHADNRRIIFSCFNPDICSMIRLKQNKYPVMFLTQGETSKYSPYNDPRCWNVKSAVSFAQMADILGVNVHTEDILRDPKLVQLARETNLIIFCWGDDNNDSNVIKYLKELGLHGIIYDKVDHYSTKEVKESIFLMEARQSQKDLIRIVAETATQVANNHQQQQQQPILKEISIDVEKAREGLEEIETCTVLDSLESVSDIMK